MASIESTYGVYAYIDQEGDVVYIGKDKSIDINERHKNHLKPSKFKAQLINQKIKEESLTYVVIALALNKDIMDSIEKVFLNEYKPKYNIRVKGQEKIRKDEHGLETYNWYEDTSNE